MEALKLQAPPKIVLPEVEGTKVANPDEIPEHFKEGKGSFLSHHFEHYSFISKNDHFPSVIAAHISYRTRPEQHPMYVTSASIVGAKNPSEADVPLKWYGLRSDFTKNFNGGMVRDYSLNCTIKKSRIHNSLDGVL
jgi:hypothetical protein